MWQCIATGEEAVPLKGLMGPNLGPCANGEGIYLGETPKEESGGRY